MVIQSRVQTVQTDQETAKKKTRGIDCMIYKKKYPSHYRKKQRKNAMFDTWVIEAKQEKAKIEGKELPFHSEYPITT